MDHLDLALNLQQEAVYSSSNTNNDEGGGEMSDRVSTLASGIYAEFERMIQKYGSDVVENLMPMIVNVLEQLESSYSEGGEATMELEMLAEDNEQLITQYEREKQLRKLAEAKYLEYEDSREQHQQDLQSVIDQLEHSRRQSETKAKQLQDQVERYEERISEQKKEYDTLHNRHSEMLHKYMERMELQSKLSPLPSTPDNVKLRKTKQGSELLSASQTELGASNTDENNLRSSSVTEIQVTSDFLTPGESRNDLSFEDEISLQVTTQDASTPLKTKKKLLASSREFLDTVEAESSQAEKLNITTSERGGVDFNEGDMNTVSEKTDSSSMFISPEAKAILDATPELSQVESEYQTPTIDIRSAQKLNQQNISLLAEMEQYDDALTVEQQGLKEFDRLLVENKDLIDVRSKLQTQKNELIRRMEEISGDREIQEEEIKALQTTKTRMKLKMTELEQSLKKVRLENEKAQLTLKNKIAEERISSANRKRFTRVEMAKVLMERNQYKERLMELQEAVRWTEMIRASKENHLNAVQQKKKSSIWRLFSNLFAGGGTSSSANTSPKKSVASTPQEPINVWYGGGANNQNQMQMQRRHTLSAQPSRYSGAESGFEGMTEKQRQERKERYKYVKEHINSEGRKQAYGWSLPSDFSGEQVGSSIVPVPVYCRPLNTEAAMKIWCASGINLEGGRTPDGNFIGLPMDFKESCHSTVWIGTSTHSCSKVTIIDANNPSVALDQFIVSSSHLLCMASVPGLSKDDNKRDPDVVDSPRKSGRQTSPEHSGSIMGIQAEEESYPDEDSVDGSQPTKVTSMLPTMWLGAQSGKVYIHSVVANWKKCLQSAKLKDSLLSIVHTQGRVLAALADGTVAIFHRKPDGRWDLSNYHLLDLGRPHHSIRCMTTVHHLVWCGYRNKVQVINPRTMKIEKSFDAHPRRESQVRQLACIGDGVWVSIRLDSTLRLYNAHTYHHLQDVDIEPYVSKMLGTSKFGFSFVRITALLLTDDRLWVGTGNGIILSVPLVSARPTRENDNGKAVVPIDISNKGALFMPYCAMVHAQLSFHGHRDSVKFFIAVPGSAANIEAAKAYSNAGARPPSPSNVKPGEVNFANLLVMSGGEGYIDFRVGDDESEDKANMSSSETSPASSKLVAVERSHLLVWQINNRKDS
ncbi:C-Jun-amino-terminal kinase-interacting protein 4-like [Clytia hemisphaerica]|uniref:C-Jun-amino-terminal kinase-interacting protein 4 n=1 Tax=Clytia hemisphaerica TaxID=252671 RepID=A0A7M5WMV2_9CNID